jgi:hypothetical protein
MRKSNNQNHSMPTAIEVVNAVLARSSDKPKSGP